MTQYMLSVHHTEDEEMPSSMEELQPIFEAVDAFNRKVMDQGAWVFGGGLEPRETATTVDASGGGEPVLADGPFAEAKEWLGGFWVIEAADLDAALAWAQEASAACRGKVEVRPFQAE